MTPEQEVSRGEQARDLLNHPLLVEAFDLIEGETIKAWEDSPARDTEGRERLWLQLKLLRRLRGHIESVVDSGKMARATLAQRAAEAAHNAIDRFRAAD